MSEVVPGLEYRELVAEMNRHEQEASFRTSELFRRHGAALDALLHTPVIDRDPDARANPDTLHVVHWNVEKGKQLEGLKARFAHDPKFQRADLIFLNEVDVGMVRAGPNADVGRELARAHGSQLIYLPSYLEATKGLGEERLLPGENDRGLHGLAILTRLPIVNVRMYPLPPCWDYFNFVEKRYGLRQGLYALLRWGDAQIVAATTHLEVRKTPLCRQLQFEAFLRGLGASLRRWGKDIPVVIAGDWNTNTFKRSGWRNTLDGFLRIWRSKPDALARELLEPFEREPLFDNLRWDRFEHAPWNDGKPTAEQLLGTVEDLSLLPPSMGEALMKAVGMHERVLEMRLDWIAARALSAAEPPRTLDRGWSDPNASATSAGVRGDEPLSDHAPITASIRRP